MGGLGLIKPWEIYLVDVVFEDSDEVKKRPVLITTDGSAYICGFKMTTLNRFGDLDYPLQLWREAGLMKPTIVRLEKKVPIPEEAETKYIGEVHMIDRQNILEICKRYNIKIDDLK